MRLQFVNAKLFSDLVDLIDSNIVANNASTLHASVERTDTKKALDTGDKATLHVVAENKSENAAIFKMYFCNVGDELSDDTSAWGEYLNKPALDMKVQDLDKDCTLPVDIKDADGQTVSASLEFLKEVKDDEILSRFAKLELPAGASTDFEFSIMSDKECDVTIIPVMVQETPVFGDADSATWEEDITFFTKVVNFFTGKTAEEDDDGIELSDVQGIEIEADTAGLNEADFTSKRLVVLTDDASVLIGKDNVIGQYDNVYLMQFDSVEKTMRAYAYYKDIVTAVEPDMAIEAATSDALNEEDVTVTSNDTEEEAALATDESNENSIAALNDAESSVAAQSTHGVIALIDTGVSEHTNVIDRVSMIDDVLTGNGHGDSMVNAIVSQDADAKILSIRAMNDNGFGTVSSLVAAMEYAIEQKVDIINLSLYARTTLSTSVLKQEILKAIDAGIIVVGAAGNDGADVKDYVPGSVEEAYIIGAAGASGFRFVTSNYGVTVDYNVVAESTSEATALFTGFISANGLDKVSEVLNQGLIYATDYKGDDIVIENPDDDIDPSETEDFSKYEVDTTKSVITKYTFAYADKLQDGDTLMSIYHTEDFWNTLLTTVMSRSEVYKVGDGTYKFKMNTPILSGYVVGGEYTDVEFVNGNDDGDIITEGVSFDTKTGIATVTEEALEKADGDWANMQVQVLVPVNGIPDRVMQDITIVNNDGSSYRITVPVYGLQIENIPLAVDGVDEELTSDDFEVYLNGERTPFTELYWDNESHALTILGQQAAAIHSVKVVVKQNVDALFQTAYQTVGPNTGYRGLSTLFYLKEGLDVSSLTVGKSTSVRTRTGLKGYDAYSLDSNPIGTAERYPKHDGGSSTGMFGFPTNLFGINFQMYRSNGQSYGTWETDDYGTFNHGINMPCVHAGDALRELKMRKHMNVHYEIIDKWQDGEYTYFVMALVSVYAHSDSPAGNQSQGGTVKFAVKSEVKGGLSIQKQSANTSLTNNNSNYSLQGAEYTIYSNSACTTAVKTITTDASGYAATGDKDLNAGTYYVKETKASKGFTLDTTKYTFTVTAGQTASANKKTSKEPPKTGAINLTKTSTLPSVTNDNKCYSLAGAEYTVYKDANCTQSTGKIIKTDNSGKGSCTGLPLGTYYVKETKASPGFKVDPKVYTAACTETGNAVTSVNVASKEEPLNDPGAIQITKIQKGDATDTIPSLEGTQFTIKYYDDMNLTKAQVSSATPKRTWVIETKKVGNKYAAGLADTYLVKSLSDAFYYAGNRVILPLGTITIQETKPAPGYTLDGAGYLTDKNGNKVSTDTDFYLAHIVNSTSGVKLQGGNEYTGYNSTYPLSVKVVKYDSDGKTPLADVQYTIKDKDGNDVKDKNGNVIQPKTTNSNGVATFENLYPNVYYITEIKTKAGLQLLKDPITVNAPMRMTKDEATANKLDVSDTSKVVWSDAENCYLIFDQTFEVTNHATFTMPMSGSIVTGRAFIPLIFGMAIFTGIAVVLFRKKKRL